MKFIPISSITVGERQRKKIDREAIVDLKRSILTNGLFNAITVQKVDGTYHLLAGETRFIALCELDIESEKYFIGGTAVPRGKVPANVYSDLSELKAATIELEENTLRTDLHWKDKAEALARIFELRKAAEPKVTKKKVAKDLTENKPTPASTVQTELSQAVLIDKYKDHPEVAEARTMGEAYKKSVDIQGRKFQAELEKRKALRAKKHGPIAFDLRHNDAITLMPKMDEGVFDIIMGDPPYGYDADNYFPNSTEVKHQYDDTPENAKRVAKAILTEGFRLCKPRGGVLLFCKPDMFNFLVDFSKQMAWAPWPNPIIWDKGSGGSAPWGKLGPRRRYELLFWATKGQRGLTKQFDEIIPIPREKTRTHGAEKPVALMEFLIDHFTSTGEHILDPCMGSGSTILAAKNLNRKATGIEIIENYYNIAMSRLAEKEDE